MIQLSVIIATYNRADNLLRTLKTLLPQTLDRSLWEIVVVNNNCSDNTSLVCEKFALDNQTLNFKMVIEKQQGLSHARNCGLKQSSGEYIVIIDDDEEVNNEFISSYYNFFEANHTAVACGGKVIPLYEFETPDWLSSYSERPIAGTINMGNKIRPFRGERYPTGGNMAFRRAAFKTYGLFNTALGRSGNSLMGGEEKDLFQRLRSGGEVIYYIPTAVMHHIIPLSRVTEEYLYGVAKMIGKSEKIRTLGISKCAYFKRLFDECIKWAATLVLLVLYTLKGRPSAGWCLVRMRRNITNGLLLKIQS